VDLFSADGQTCSGRNYQDASHSNAPLGRSDFIPRRFGRRRKAEIPYDGQREFGTGGGGDGHEIQRLQPSPLGRLYRPVTIRTARSHREMFSYGTWFSVAGVSPGRARRQTTCTSGGAGQMNNTELSVSATHGRMPRQLPTSMSIFKSAHHHSTLDDSGAGATRFVPLGRLGGGWWRRRHAGRPLLHLNGFKSAVALHMIGRAGPANSKWQIFSPAVPHPSRRWKIFGELVESMMTDQHFSRPICTRE